MATPGTVILKTPSYVLTHAERGSILQGLSPAKTVESTVPYGTTAAGLGAMLEADKSETLAALAGILNSRGEAAAAAVPAAAGATPAAAPAARTPRAKK